MKVDPSIYDAPTFNPIVSDAGLPNTNYVAPTPVAQATVLEGTQGAAIAQASNAEASREKANHLASLGAVVSEWSPVQAYRYFSGPTVEPETDFQVGSLLPTLPITLDETEREFLLGARSHAEYSYKLEAIDRQRVAQRAGADHPVVAFLGGMIDPGYLAIDVASLGAGRIARIGQLGLNAERAASGVAATAGTYALGRIEQTQRPMSDNEVIGGALLNGAATAMLYSVGKGLTKADPEFPGEVLNNLAEAVSVPNPDKGLLPPISFSAPDGANRSGRELLDSIAPVYKGTEYEELINVLRSAPELDGINVTTGSIAQSMAPKARGFMSTKGDSNLLFIREGVEADVPLHELVHAVLQPRLLSDPKVRAEISAMRSAVVTAMAKQGGKSNDTRFLVSQLDKNDNEFIAYAYTSPTFRKWAKANEITSTGETRRVEATQRANSTVFEDPNLGVERPGFLPQATVWDKLVQWFGDKLGITTPRARRMAEMYNKRNEWDSMSRLPAMERKWKTLDDRLKELMQQAAKEGSPNLYTRGTLKQLDPSMDMVEMRKRISKLADKEYIGSRISWSLHKSMAAFGDVGKKVADLLVDNPLDMQGDSVVSQARAIRAGLTDVQFQYEDLLTRELAARGAGIKNRILKPRQSLQVQKEIEKELQLEMLRRERNNRMGSATPSKAKPEIQKMADTLDKLYADALKEMQAAGVSGADAVAETSGYFSRKWDISNIDEAKNRLVNAGHTLEEADKKLLQIVQQGVRRANGWDADVARTVARAILDRAHRKGYFEDSSFRSHAGNEAAKEMRDILVASGASAAQVQKAMDVMTAVVDEAGKMSSLKHRVDIDMKAGIALPDGTTLTVSDLINSDLTRSTEAYLDQVSGRIAMARKGLPDVSDIDKLRTEVLESIPSVSERADAAKLFDDTVDSILGRPTGGDIPKALRMLQAVTRMVGLASSALWQVTEYAPAMARYGALKTLKYAMKEATFAAVRNPDYKTSKQLVDVLSRNSSADIRIRPFINRMEDNFEVPAGDIVQAALLQAQQLVPYVNAQKYVQTHQARVVANLVVDTFRLAGEGDQKAIKALEGYGLEPHIVTKIQPELKAAGMDTAQWSDETWAAVRGPLTKMMDDSVLRNRTGEIPAFAQFSQVGKFIFTFRSFVLGAHNKVLAGTINRDGLAGISLLMAYQFPLVLLATQANSTIQGKEIADTEELIAKSFGQMGSLGLFSELFGVVTGQKQQFGAPGLIAVDRLYKLAGDAASMDAGQAAAGAIQATPVLSIIPGVRAIGEALKETTKE